MRMTGSLPVDFLEKATVLFTDLPYLLTVPYIPLFSIICPKPYFLQLNNLEEIDNH